MAVGPTVTVADYSSEKTTPIYHTAGALIISTSLQTGKTKSPETEPSLRVGVELWVMDPGFLSLLKALPLGDPLISVFTPLIQTAHFFVQADTSKTLKPLLIPREMLVMLRFTTAWPILLMVRPVYK